MRIQYLSLGPVGEERSGGEALLKLHGAYFVILHGAESLNWIGTFEIL